VYAGLLVVIIIGGAVLVSWARKQMVESRSGEEDGFTISEIREMKERGELSEAEYAAARDLLMGKDNSSSAVRSDVRDEPGRADGS